jgi:hypothetical protein
MLHRNGVETGDRPPTDVESGAAPASLPGDE